MTETNRKEVVDLKMLPLWHGVQPSPDLHCAPFALEVDERGLVRLCAPEITNEVIGRYGKETYNFPTSPPGSSEWGNRLAQRSLDGLLKTFGDVGGLDILELGGGTLYCARHMIENLGANSVKVVDPAVKDRPDVDGLEVMRAYFSEETALTRTYKLIVSFNTLEHVPDPAAFLTAARRHLDDGGRIFLKVPDCAHSLRKGDLGMCTHEHLSYFTPDSLDALLRYTGFERVSQANYLGALQVLARKSEPDPRARWGASAQLLATFSNMSASHMRRLREYGDRHQGQKCAFIGASVGLCNVLYLSRIAERLDIEVYDGDALKTGRYVPGFDRPILLTDDAKLETHSQIFITPVNFFDEIRSGLRHRPGLSDSRISPVFP